MSERFGEKASELSSAASLLLGWRPGEFWNSTPIELANAISVGTLTEAPDAATIEELRRRFPDELR